MFVKIFFTLAFWISTLFSSSQSTVQITIPKGTNPFNIESSKIVKYLEAHPTTEFNSRVVFVDKDENYKLVHLMGKVPVDVRYREKTVIDVSMSREDLQDKLDKLNSALPNVSDTDLLAILGNMNETIKVSE